MTKHIASLTAFSWEYKVLCGTEQPDNENILESHELTTPGRTMSDVCLACFVEWVIIRIDQAVKGFGEGEDGR
jgi:hypothetical protein